MWRSLQELAGIHNSHAARLLEQERKIWAEELHRETELRETQPGAAAGVPAAPAIAPTQIETTAEKPSDDPYIETSRCTSCNECTQINDKMFGYDANKQASIVNPDAGTYRQLVEAAESCQVSIIHPASHGIQTSRGSRSCWRAPNPSGRPAGLGLDPTVVSPGAIWLNRGLRRSGPYGSKLYGAWCDGPRESLKHLAARFPHR